MVLHLPMEFSCCFHCSTKSIKSKVQKLLQSKKSLPNEAAWNICRERMLIPVLRRIARVDKRCEERWLDNNSLPKRFSEQTKINFSEIIRKKYWNLCFMVQQDYAHYNTEYKKVLGTEDPFFIAFSNICENIMRMIFKFEKKRIITDEIHQLWSQIRLLRNHDDSMEIVQKVSYSRHENLAENPTLLHFVDNLTRIGTLDYALVLAENTTGIHAPTMSRFEEMITERIEIEKEKRLILAVSLNDKNSSLFHLGPDLLRIIMTPPPEMVMWEEVLSGYIEHDIMAII